MLGLVTGIAIKCHAESGYSLNTALRMVRVNIYCSQMQIPVRYSRAVITPRPDLYPISAAYYAVLDTCPLRMSR